MRIKKILLILLVMSLIPVIGWADDGSNDSNHGSDPGFFVGINPLAPFTQMNNIPGKYGVPFLSNLEYGLAMNCGYFLNDSHALELRIASGLSALNILVTQASIGYNFFPLDLAGITDTGLHLGPSFRFWDSYYLNTDIHYLNVSSELVAGYWWQIFDQIFIDLRVDWPFAVASWSTLEHTGANVSFVAFPPSLGFNIGYRF